MNGLEQMSRVALDAAARGWHVFPLAVGSKRPALHGQANCPGTGACDGGHRGWEQRATTDPDRIRRAWAHAPYNVGIATGPSGLCVLDLDTADDEDIPPERWARHGARCGEDVLAVVAAEAGQDMPGETLTVATPSSGLHLYFAAPAGSGLRNTSGETGRGLGWKVDTRAGGGYVVAPGSVTGTGAYRYVYDGPVAPLPGWLAERLAPAPLPPAPVEPIRPGTGRAGRYVMAAVREECRRVAEARTHRNAALYAASVALGQLVAGGSLPEAEARQALRTAAGRHVGVRAFTAHEADKTITSGLAAGAHRPRHIAA